MREYLKATGVGNDPLTRKMYVGSDHEGGNVSAHTVHLVLTFVHPFTICLLNIEFSITNAFNTCYHVDC